jgi:hypothetical protein
MFWELFTMTRCAAAPVRVSAEHRHRLEAILRQHHAPQSLVMRARIILMAGAGVGVHKTARELQWVARLCSAFGYPGDIPARADLPDHRLGL